MNKKNQSIAFSVVAGLSLWACGDNDNVECAEGTTLTDGQCVPDGQADLPQTFASPAGGTYRMTGPGSVLLTSSVPATVYYTTDGSDPTTDSASGPSPVMVSGIIETTELKFFAVDENGGQEDIKTESYLVNTNGPGPVTGLTAVASGGDNNLSWDNPDDDDLAGVIVVTSGALASQFSPVDGTSYGEGDDLGAGQTVLFSGDAEAASDSGAVAGTTHYAVWAFDDALQYSPIARTTARQAIGAQTASFSVALDNTVTITQPDNVVLSATAVYDDDADTITLSVEAQNPTGEVFTAPKIVAENINAGQLENASGTLDGEAYYALGPNALVPGATASVEILLDNIDGATDPITFDASLVENQMVYVPSYGYNGADTPVTLMDADTYQVFADLECDQYIGPLNSSGYCSWSSAVVSADERFVYAGNRSQAMVRVVDTASHATVDAIVLDAQGSVSGLAWSADGSRLYATFNAQGHAHPYSGYTGVESVYLVEIDPVERREVRRMVLADGSALAEDDIDNYQVRARYMDISPDGSTAAVPLWYLGEIALVDLETFTLIDTDSETVGVQRLATAEDGPREVFYSPTGSLLAVGFSGYGFSGDFVEIFDTETLESNTIVQGNAYTSSSVHWVDDDNFWVTWTYPGDEALVAYDISGGFPAAATTLETSVDFRGHVVTSDGRVLISSRTNEQVAAFTSDGTAIDIDDFVGNGLTSADLGRGSAHKLAITP